MITSAKSKDIFNEKVNAGLREQKLI